MIRHALIPTRIALTVCTLAACASRLTAAGEPANVKTLMTSPGATLAEDSFAGSLPKAWHAAKGKWEVVDGAAHGTEIPADKHQAVMRRPLAFANAVISFSFRLDQSRQISLSINDAKEHVCRVLINPRGFVVQKDDHDHDGPDKAVVFARIPMAISPDEWHTALVEIQGAEMVAQVDGQTHVGFGAHELLNRPKANVGLTVAGGPAEFRDFIVRATEARPDWAQVKAALPKPAPLPPVRRQRAK